MAIAELLKQPADRTLGHLRVQLGDGEADGEHLVERPAIGANVAHEAEGTAVQAPTATRRGLACGEVDPLATVFPNCCALVQGERAPRRHRWIRRHLVSMNLGQPQPASWQAPRAGWP